LFVAVAITDSSPMFNILSILFVILHVATIATSTAVDPLWDSRWIPNGNVLRSGGYSCQPYCSVLPDGTWSCVMTFIHAPVWIEGRPGEHMVSMRSKDHGKTFDKFVTIEPYSNTSTGQVSAYGSIAARKDGSRIFALWIQNVNNVSHVPGSKPSNSFRADMLGNFVWKYSDDQGLTWSNKHYTIPVPYNFIESINTFSKKNNGTGDVQIMWEVDHLKTMKDNTLIFAFTKIGTYAVAAPEEIFILASKNILTENNPDLVVWDMWPHGEHGIGAVYHPDDPNIVTEEPHVMPIQNDEVLYIVWRTNQGYMGHSQSQRGDFTKEFGKSSFAKYLPTWADKYENCSYLKHPRGPLSPKRQPNGLILMTYYNTAPLGAFATKMKVNDRNNMWLTVGHETNETVLWSQPELVLYERDRTRGHGYPDIITDLDGKIYITETYKSSPQSEAKTHEISMKMINLLYAQTTINTIVTTNVTAYLNVSKNTNFPGKRVPLPNFQKYDHDQYGFSVDMWLSTKTTSTSTTTATNDISDDNTPIELVSAFDQHGMYIDKFKNGTVMLTMIDSNGKIITFGTGPTCSKRIRDAISNDDDNQHIHIGVIVDGGPQMIQFIVDGKLCDGGTDLIHWPNGHHLMDPSFGNIGGSAGSLVTNVNLIKGGHLYGRSLYVTEMIGNWRGGAKTYK
jgi:hypothetical protein